MARSLKDGMLALSTFPTKRRMTIAKITNGELPERVGFKDVATVQRSGQPMALQREVQLLSTPLIHGPVV